MITPVYIVNPIGLDKKIQNLQKKLQSANIVDVCYGKAERVYLEGKSTPFINFRDIDYFEILQNDNVISHLFFLPDEETANITMPYIERNVSIFVFADLKKYDATKKHRATEEIINTIVNFINNSDSMNWKLEKITNGIEKSLKEFSNYNYQNLQPFFVFRLDYKTKYELNQNCF